MKNSKNPEWIKGLVGEHAIAVLIQRGYERRGGETYLFGSPAEIFELPRLGRCGGVY